MMVFDDINIPIILGLLFFIIFLCNKGKDASTLCLSLLFGGMVVDYWLNIKGLNDTYISTAWSVFYCITMIILIPIMLRKTIKDIKYIKAKIKKNRTV
ncbi:hypothetical protein CN324_20180 [Bacillus anthracis]|uniref:Permease n=2 Tax=Bacillus TaxID=1386 RepID=A0ABD7ZLC0_9BACI|nr:MULTISPECIES: hypothetical protein [Bacillus]AJH72977.1 putative membrane protein [Bacillus cereus ATCC 4342]AJI07028.1 putative membrane protein [Bacillus cereus G9241]PED56145.1 hypothetical protein CON50_08060 [Bacillus anthracis]AIY76629.1 putative membrane protein [Bacillus cereus]AJG96370.1 putative membrane protein [Bacillus cereus]